MTYYFIGGNMKNLKEFNKICGVCCFVAIGAVKQLSVYYGLQTMSINEHCKSCFSKLVWIFRLSGKVNYQDK
jgi:hypothetical protein